MTGDARPNAPDLYCDRTILSIYELAIKMRASSAAIAAVVWIASKLHRVRDGRAHYDDRIRLTAAQLAAYARCSPSTIKRVRKEPFFRAVIDVQPGTGGSNYATYALNLDEVTTAVVTYIATLSSIAQPAHTEPVLPAHSEPVDHPPAQTEPEPAHSEPEPAQCEPPLSKQEHEYSLAASRASNRNAGNGGRRQSRQASAASDSATPQPPRRSDEENALTRQAADHVAELVRLTKVPDEEVRAALAEAAYAHGEPKAMKGAADLIAKLGAGEPIRVSVAAALKAYAKSATPANGSAQARVWQPTFADFLEEQLNGKHGRGAVADGARREWQAGNMDGPNIRMFRDSYNATKGA